MKLAAIYNIWDGVELLEASMNCLKGHVDVFILVYQKVSNYGEDFDPLSTIQGLSGFTQKIIPYEYYPTQFGLGFLCEKEKRNIGLDIAKQLGCTHFLHVDCDEMYEDFGEAKRLYLKSGRRGSVCKLYTYFKNPTWRFDTPDGYYVPFIHKLGPQTIARSGKYPFYVDPTRRINEYDVHELPVYMHHFSWVRLDIERKCRNSSAKKNIERGTMLDSYYDPKCGPGFYVKDYDKTLIEVDDYFDLGIKFTKSDHVKSFNL